MSNRLDTLLERMPRHFAREPDTNNYKLLKIIAQHSEDNRALYDTVLKYWDVDQAEGVGLDRLGKDEGISRGGWDDDEYRKMIKIQCIVNLSEGDLDTMNLILDAYMRKGFIGLQDGWGEFEPASLIVNVSADAEFFPDWLVKRIKPAGVGLYVMLNQLNDFILLYAGTYAWQLNYKICGRFKTAATHGVLGKEILSAKEVTYGFITNTRICGRFRAGGAKN